MTVYFKCSWDQDFADLMMHLIGKYGRAIFSENGIGDQMDLHKFSKEFFKNDTTTADVSIDANANVTSRSVIEYNFEFPKPLQKYNSHFLLWKALTVSKGREEANRIIESQINGDIYINDFSDIGRPYCFNFSTYDIALEGLGMSSRMSIKPPKSLSSFIRQIEQFTVYAANSTLGATGLADFLIVAAGFMDRILRTGYDGNIRVVDSDIYVSELLRSFIYTINWEFRGNQSPFTNVSIYDRNFLKDLVPDYKMPDGEPISIETVESIQSIFIKAMNSELERSDLTFPVCTACFLTNDDNEIMDESFLHFVATENLKAGFINIFNGKTSTLSSCCRLRSDRSNEYFNSFGAGSTKIGSLGVVTANFFRMAVKAKRQADSHWDTPSLRHRKALFFDLVGDSVRDVAAINDGKREIIKERIELGCMPLYTLGHMSLSKQYSTYGVNGLNEALEVLGLDICTPEGSAFVVELLEMINGVNDEMQIQYYAPHNCEQVPAESSAVKLAKRDIMLGYQDGEYPLYSNQFIPLTVGADMLDRLKLQGMFDKHFSGGAICHVNVGEQITDVEKMKDLMRYAAKCGVIYFAVNYALKRCEDDHLWVNGDTCPTCGKAIDRIVTRVVGFFTNVKNWNKTRREHDLNYRQFYSDIKTR
ncbi:ribonucleoside-triphosphate reductase [Candidatus Pacearchaeota archaeon]|nr:ribonucleoside-triphosphate reductase [Candidatus Pacearchaeota archaeon]